MIRLTYVSNNVRGWTEEYDTDDSGEALAKAVRKWYATGSLPEENVVFAIVLERDDHRLSREEIAEKVADIAEMERARAHRVSA